MESHPMLFSPAPSSTSATVGVDDPSESCCMVGSQEEGGRQRCRGGGSSGEKKARKPRYAFQTRSQVDVLDDGYRWRKYGQKTVKNSKFSRSYYRCTRNGCSVKKQVQRQSGDDEAVVVTTYDGVHNHPVDKPSDSFEEILSRMHVDYPSF